MHLSETCDIGNCTLKKRIDTTQNLCTWISESARSRILLSSCYYHYWC